MRRSTIGWAVGLAAFGLMLGFSDPLPAKVAGAVCVVLAIMAVYDDLSGNLDRWDRGEH